MLKRDWIEIQEMLSLLLQSFKVEIRWQIFLVLSSYFVIFWDWLRFSFLMKRAHAQEFRNICPGTRKQVKASDPMKVLLGWLTSFFKFRMSQWKEFCESCSSNTYSVLYTHAQAFVIDNFDTTAVITEKNKGNKTVLEGYENLRKSLHYQQ